MIVDFSAEAMKKMGIAVGVGTLISGMMLKAIPQITFEMNPLAWSMFGGLGGLFGGGAKPPGLEGEEESDGEEATLDTIAEKLDALIAAATGGETKKDTETKEPVQIVIGNRVIEEIGSQIKNNDSYNIGHGSAGEEG